MTNFNFSFHETFAPQSVYLAKILALANDKFHGTKEEISNLTGIPTGVTSGKVVPHIKYLKYMGLVNYEEKQSEFRLDITDLGYIVFDNDPNIMENLTKFLMHYNLTKAKSALQWNYVFREYEYILDTENSFKEIGNKGFELYGKDIKIRPIKTMYTSGDFYSLGLVEFDKDNIIFNEKYDSFEFYNAYAYLLLKEWEEILPNKIEITLDELLNKIKWGKALALGYDTIMDILDELVLLKVIKLNKQLNPMTIIKLANSESLLTSLYDNLI